MRIQNRAQGSKYLIVEKWEGNERKPQIQMSTDLLAAWIYNGNSINNPKNHEIRLCSHIRSSIPVSTENTENQHFYAKGTDNQHSIPKRGRNFVLAHSSMSTSEPVIRVTESAPGVWGTMGRGVTFKYHHPCLGLTFVYLFWTFLPFLLSSSYTSSSSSSVIWFPIY
jgi:hypothetical protein